MKVQEYSGLDDRPFYGEIVRCLHHMRDERLALRPHDRNTLATARVRTDEEKFADVYVDLTHISKEL